MWIRKISGGLAVLAVSAGASAQSYFDFGDIPGVSDSPTVDINLNQALLRIVTEAAGEQDPAAAELLRSIDGVRVRVYEELRSSRQVANFVDNVSETLEEQGWQRVVFVEEEDSKVRIYMQLGESLISGMTVMVVDNSEAVFINIAGAISPEHLGNLAGQFGIEDMIESMAGMGAVFAPPVPGEGGENAAGIEGGNGAGGNGAGGNGAGGAAVPD